LGWVKGDDVSFIQPFLFDLIKSKVAFGDSLDVFADDIKL
jgi:hypothetical protein